MFRTFSFLRIHQPLNDIENNGSSNQGAPGINCDPFSCFQSGFCDYRVPHPLSILYEGSLLRSGDTRLLAQQQQYILARCLCVMPAIFVDEVVVWIMIFPQIFGKNMKRHRGQETIPAPKNIPAEVRKLWFAQ
ncbi:hypothetical protein Mapa_016306 [Marchantia paleacea]|nr:hypothetical protein Mapa_016306 [Marchantia paleacea]